MLHRSSIQQEEFEIMQVLGMIRVAVERLLEEVMKIPIWRIFISHVVV